MNSKIQKTINKLDLSSNREENIRFFLTTVSYYKLLPYIDFVKNNPEIAEKINLIFNGKDNWDAVVGLYRYNIKLSHSIYPYIYLLETTLKTQVNNLFCEIFGFDWYLNQSVLHRANKNSVNYLNKKAEDYLKEANNPNVMDFTENHTTLGYWISIIESGNFWNSNDIKLRKIFSANDKLNPATLSLKEITKKLRTIKDLRNCIAHHNQIIGCRIDRKGFSKLKLWDIYQNILELFYLLGCDDLNWMLGDLICQQQEFCQGNSFELLYNQLDFIHSMEIKADKVLNKSSVIINPAIKNNQVLS